MAVVLPVPIRVVVVVVVVVLKESKNSSTLAFFLGRFHSGDFFLILFCPTESVSAVRSTTCS